MLAKKDHTDCDACDDRHDKLLKLETTLDFQGRLLWFILFALLGGLLKIFGFGG